METAERLVKVARSRAKVNRNSFKKNSEVHEICIKLLTQGHIRSFDTFFHLTHESDKSCSKKKSEDPEQKSSCYFVEKQLLPSDEKQKEYFIKHLDDPSLAQNLFTIETLRTLETLLTNAEDSLLIGPKQAIYNSKKQLALYFQDIQKCDIAISYFREVLELTRSLDSNNLAEIESCNSLGIAMDKNGEYSKAVSMFLRSRSLAKQNNLDDAVTEASRNLINTRIKMSEIASENGKYDEAIENYLQCLEVANQSVPDKELINEVEYRLGKAYESAGMIEKASKCLEGYLSESRSLKDKIKEGLAQSALAQCHEKAGESEIALHHLQEYYQLTKNDESRKELYAEACYKLGVMSNKMGMYEQAAKYLTTFFELAEGKKNGQQEWNSNISRTSAKVQLGIAQGNSFLPTFMGWVSSGQQEHLKHLIDWKAYRSKPQPRGQSTTTDAP